MLGITNILKSSFSKLAGRNVYIVASKRTPIASYLGAFSEINAPLLASHAIKACLNELNLKGDDINEVLLGNVC